MMKLLRIILALSISTVVLGTILQQTPNAQSRADNSDWWSMLRSLNGDQSIRTQERELPATNFRLLGIEVGDKMFAEAEAKLGKATHVVRGDAGTAREQVCYVSAGDGEKLYLVFEQGEVESAFYLFNRGPDWSGSDQCAPSKLITKSVFSSSGLRLGLTPEQVVAILGRPSKHRSGEWVYCAACGKKDFGGRSKEGPTKQSRDERKGDSGKLQLLRPQCRRKVEVRKLQAHVHVNL